MVAISAPPFGVRQLRFNVGLTMRFRLILLALVGAACSDAESPRTPSETQVVTALELDTQRRADMDTIQALRAAGSDLSKPHTLEHHFICPTRDRAAPILKWGSANGFQPSDVLDGVHEGEAYVFFDLIKLTVPDIERVFPVTSEMLRLAKKHSAEYDGWGCPTVR